MWNPVLRGWINYYGKFYTTALVETVVAEGYVRRTIPERSSRGSEIVSELVNGTPV
ncbi:MAG: hypothetical protein JO166_07685 [Deltaproteobacteria bacterium]|nr:hypothetical protein [Deltaproteobacteria bacterium]